MIAEQLDASQRRDMWRNVSLLAICQALMQSCNALLIATSGLVGLVLAPLPVYATLSLGLQFLATMCATLPASLLMKRIGRRSGFLCGTAFGLTGALLCVLGVLSAHFVLFCAGSILIGVFNAFGHYYRFAAADASSPMYRARAISLVLSGGLLAAFAGPNLASATRSVIDNIPFAGSFAALSILYVTTGIVLLFVSIPKPDEVERGRRTRSLWQLVGQPTYLIAVLGAMVSYGVMNLVMVSTPLAMQGHGYDFASTATVIQWHIVGMYLPSFFTGHLIDRWGKPVIMAVGSCLLLAAAFINLGGSAQYQFVTALVLLGVGWNFLFTGSTTLLTLCYRPEEKALAQGLNDTMMFATMALTSASAGFLYHGVGWTALNVGVMPFVFLVLILIGVFSVRAPSREIST